MKSECFHTKSLNVSQFLGAFQLRQFKIVVFYVLNSFELETHKLLSDSKNFFLLFLVSLFLTLAGL